MKNEAVAYVLEFWYEHTKSAEWAALCEVKDDFEFYDIPFSAQV